METPFKPEGSKRRKLKKILKKKPANLQSSLTSNSYHKKVKAAINVSLNSTRNVRTLQANNRCLANGLERWKRECRMVHDKCNYLLKKNHELRERIMELERFTLVSPKFTKEDIERKYKLRVEKELFSCVQVFIEKVSEVMESCRSEPPEELSLLNLSMPLSLSMTAMQGLDDNDDDDDAIVEPVFKKSKVQDLSLIAEQSILHQSSAGLPLVDNLEQITEYTSPLSKTKEKILSKLPLRVPVQSKDLSIRNTAQDLNAESNHLASPEKVPKSSGKRKSTKSPTDFTDLMSPQSDLGKNIPSDLKENSVLKEIKKPLYVNSRSPKSKTLKSVKKKDKSRKLLKSSPKKDVPIITNEFALVNSHLEMMKKLQTVEKNNPKDTVNKSSINLDITSLSVVDMELTAGNSTTSIEANNTENIEKPGTKYFEIDGTAKDLEDCISNVEPVIDELIWADQKFPDAVTLRRGKPGQIIFAASRKDSDGTRKNIPVVLPAKSRSRKKKNSDRAEMFSSDSSPQSIFDFHDKTPKGLAEPKAVDQTVFNITGDTSSTSPLPSLSKFRQGLANADVSVSGTQLHKDIHNLSKQMFSLLDNEPEFEMPLKDSPDTGKSLSLIQRRTRSQSRSKKKRGEDEESTRRARSQGRKSIIPITPVTAKQARSKSKTNERNSPASSIRKVRSRRKTFLVSKDTEGVIELKPEKNPVIVTSIMHTRRKSIASPTNLSKKSPSNSPPLSINSSKLVPVVKSASILLLSDKSDEVMEILEMNPSDKDDDILISKPSKAQSKKSQNISLGIQKGKSVVKTVKEIEKLAPATSDEHKQEKNEVMIIKSDTEIPVSKRQKRKTALVKSHSFEILAEVHQEPLSHTVSSHAENSCDDSRLSSKAPRDLDSVTQFNHHEKLADEIEILSVGIDSEQENDHPSKSVSEKFIKKNKGHVKSKRVKSHSRHVEKPSQALDCETNNVAVSDNEIFKKDDLLKESENTAQCERKCALSDTQPTAGEDMENDDGAFKNRDSFAIVTSQLLKKVKHLKTPKLSVNDENLEKSKTFGYKNKREKNSVTDTTSSSSSPFPKLVKNKTKKVNSPSHIGNSTPKTVADVDQNTVTPFHNKKKTSKSPSHNGNSNKALGDVDQNTLSTSHSNLNGRSPPLKRGIQDIVSSDVPEIKRRRAASKVPNYAEVSLKVKMRRDHPISSHYCSSENIQIYQEKIKGKLKKVHKTTFESLQNQSIQEEN